MPSRNIGGLLTFKITGSEKVLSRLQRMKMQFGDKVCAALHDEGEAIMKESKSEYVPVRDGILRSSGKVHPCKREGRDISVELSYGNSAAFYALDQHENPNYRHRVGQWKYLETPLRMREPSVAGNIAKALKNL